MQFYKILTLVTVTILCSCNPSTDKEKPLDAGTEPPAVTEFAAPIVKPDNEIDQATDVTSDALIGANAEKESKAPLPVKQEVNIRKKIVKYGDISFETADVVKTRKEILTSLKQYGGYAESDSETINGSENRKEYVLDIRIPAEKFDTFLSGVSGTATKIDAKNIHVKDVTAEYIDIKARLDNKLQLEKRYLGL